MAERLPPHVTAPLLAKVFDSALDEDYRLAAERPRPPGRRSRVPGLVALAVIGLLLAVAAVETSQGRGARESGRSDLVAEATSRRDLLADQQARLAELRAANIDTNATVADLTDAQRTSEDRLQRLRTVTGYGAVRGPGVRIEVDAAPNGDAADDMAQLLDGLWTAGAEAVSVNGRRITALTRIASTGPAVSLDGRSLVPPYTVLAVGDPDTLQARFAESSSGAGFRSLSEALLFDFTMTNAEGLELPAAVLPASLDLDLGSSDEDLPERSDP